MSCFLASKHSSKLVTAELHPRIVIHSARARPLAPHAAPKPRSHVTVFPTLAQTGRSFSSAYRSQDADRVGHGIQTAQGERKRFLLSLPVKDEDEKYRSKP